MPFLHLMDVYDHFLEVRRSRMQQLVAKNPTKTETAAVASVKNGNPDPKAKLIPVPVPLPTLPQSTSLNRPSKENENDSEEKEAQGLPPTMPILLTLDGKSSMTTQNLQSHSSTLKPPEQTMTPSKGFPSKLCTSESIDPNLQMQNTYTNNGPVPHPISPGTISSFSPSRQASGSLCDHEKTRMSVEDMQRCVNQAFQQTLNFEAAESKSSPQSLPLPNTLPQDSEPASLPMTSQVNISGEASNHLPNNLPVSTAVSTPMSQQTDKPLSPPFAPPSSSQSFNSEMQQRSPPVSRWQHFQTGESVSSRPTWQSTRIREPVQTLPAPSKAQTGGSVPPGSTLPNQLPIREFVQDVSSRLQTSQTGGSVPSDPSLPNKRIREVVRIQPSLHPHDSVSRVSTQPNSQTREPVTRVPAQPRTQNLPPPVPRTDSRGRSRSQNSNFPSNSVPPRENSRGWVIPQSDLGSYGSNNNSNSRTYQRDGYGERRQSYGSGRGGHGGRREETEDRYDSHGYGRNRRSGNQNRYSSYRNQHDEPFRPPLDPSVRRLIDEIIRYSPTVNRVPLWIELTEECFTILKTGFSDLIEYCFSELFGGLWKDVVKLPPPWTGNVIPTLLEGHWKSTFHLVFKPELLKTVVVLKSVIKRIMTHSATAENTIELIARTRDMIEQCVFSPMNEKLGYDQGEDNEHPITFQQAETNLHQAKRSIRIIAEKCQREATALLEKNTPSGNTVSEENQRNAQTQSNDTYPTPLDRPRTNGLTNNDSFAHHEASSSNGNTSDVMGLDADVTWIRSMGNNVNIPSKTAATMLQSMQMFLVQVADHASRMKKSFTKGTRMSAGMLQFQSKLYNLCGALRKMNDEFEKRSIQQRTATDVLTALKDMMTLCFTDAFRYCRFLQNPEERYLVEFKNKLAENNGKILKECLHDFGRHYKFLSGLMFQTEA